MGDAQALKDEGNKLFQEGEWLKSAALYTQAIKLDPENAVLYSNRSAALLKLKKVTKATEDAEKCIQLRPDWEKGYFRKGAVLEDQGNLAEALEVYQQALKLVPDSKELSQKIRTLGKVVNKSKQSSSEGGGKADTKAVPVSSPTSQPAASAAQPGGNTAAEVAYEDMGSEEVARFAEEFLALLGHEIKEHGTSFEPMVHFLPGPCTEATDEEMQHVKGLGAFESPETLHGFVDFLRQTAQRLDAEAALTLVPRNKIGYPQVWLKPKWPGGSDDGVLALLESRKVKRCWWIPVQGHEPGAAKSISPEDFGVLPPVIRT